MMRASATVLSIVIAALAAPAFAQNDASKVGKAQIAQYRKQAESACRQSGAKQGDSEEKVRDFCSCLFGSLDKTMTVSDWQQAYFQSSKGRPEEELKVLEPHLKASSGECAR